MKPLPPLPALRAFEAVARLGSVVKAAEELHVTHGAISQQLRALEDYLGFSLFLRHGRRLAITEDGRIYALRLHMALGDIASATSDVLSLPRADELIVAVLPSFGAHWLVRRLPRFGQRHPELKLTLRAGLEVVDFQIDRVDVAIRMGAGSWEGLSQMQLFQDETIAVAATRFNDGRLPRTPAAVMRAPQILSVDSWSAWLTAAGLPDQVPHGPIYTDSNLKIEALRQGQGVAVTRRSLVHDLIRSGELRQLTGVAVPYGYPYWLVWPPRSQGAAKLRAFAAWLEEEVKAYLADVAALQAATRASTTARRARGRACSTRCPGSSSS